MRLDLRLRFNDLINFQSDNKLWEFFHKKASELDQTKAGAPSGVGAAAAEGLDGGEICLRVWDPIQFHDFIKA